VFANQVDDTPTLIPGLDVLSVSAATSARRRLQPGDCPSIARSRSHFLVVTSGGAFAAPNVEWGAAAD
jgi:hypothetical protein